MKTILVVDDEADIRKSLKTILEKEKYTVITATNGDDALKKIEKTKPNLILLDIMMPGTPVKEIVKKIKGIPIVFCSVMRTTEAEKEELLSNKNIKGFIQKPFEIEEVLKTVKKLAK